MFFSLIERRGGSLSERAYRVLTNILTDLHNYSNYIFFAFEEGGTTVTCKKYFSKGIIIICPGFTQLSSIIGRLKTQEPLEFIR